MSQIALTETERTQALMRLGYTEREASFLCLTALQGGFFLRRQYCQFIQKEIGGSAAVLVEKVVSKGHGTAVTGCRGTKVYHLSARPFYAALGQEDNRNRRARPPVVIRNKLMCLDYVLDHPGHHFLATEQEKVSHFACTLGIEIGDLPTKLFRAPNADDSSSRFFVDKHPVFVSERAASSRQASFCFVDEGLVTGCRFESYLKQYSRLFARLDRFEIIYVAAHQAPFVPAERIFRNLLMRPQGGRPTGSGAWDLDRLAEHFGQRHRYETGQHQCFDRAQLIRLRNDRQEFAGRFFDALYRRWKTGGIPALRQTLEAQGPAPNAATGRFSTYLLRHSYDVFGS